MKMTVSLRYFYSLKILVIKIILLNQISKNTIDFDPNAALRGILIPPPPKSDWKAVTDLHKSDLRGQPGKLKAPRQVTFLGGNIQRPQRKLPQPFSAHVPKEEKRLRVKAGPG